MSLKNTYNGHAHVNGSGGTKTDGATAIPFDKQQKDTVTILNCTYSDLEKPGAEEKHKDAARRAYGYFKNQSYDGPTIMVMVDSSSKTNPEMENKAKTDPDFFYFHIPDRNDKSHIHDSAGDEVASHIKGCDFFRTEEFEERLAWAREQIDSDVTHPLENTRPPLGSKRNFGIAFGEDEWKRRERESDIVVYFDDDIYGPNYVKNTVAELQDGKVFTAAVSYPVAFPVADDERGGYHVEHGIYTYGQDPQRYEWLDEKGHRTNGEGKILSTLPYGFTYAFRTKAWEEVGKIAEILRGEDRSLLIPLINRYGEDAINLRTFLCEDLVRLLGDNNSHNAISSRHTSGSLLTSLQFEAERTIAGSWKTMLENKFGELTGTEKPAPSSVTISPSPQRDFF